MISFVSLFWSRFIISWLITNILYGESTCVSSDTFSFPYGLMILSFGIIVFCFWSIFPGFFICVLSKVYITCLWVLLISRMSILLTITNRYVTIGMVYIIIAVNVCKYNFILVFIFIIIPMKNFSVIRRIYWKLIERNRILTLK